MLLSIAAGVASGTALASGDLLPGYNAVYEVYNRDRAVGEAEFSVTLLDAERGIYEFRSVSRARGLYRLFVPRPAEEFSVFVLENGRIRPLAYSLRDGTRRDRNSFNVEFDWEHEHAVITAGETRLEPQLRPGILDRGSLQAALMLLAEDFSTEQVTLLDRDGPEIHELRADGEETLDTGGGPDPDPQADSATAGVIPQNPGLAGAGDARVAGQNRTPERRRNARIIST